MKPEDLTLEQKIAQLFITGFKGENFQFNRNFVKLLELGLGGVIFFTHNIKSETQFRQLNEAINKQSFIPPFLSIDQEGGRVERTERIHNGKKYLSAKPAFNMGLSFLQNQTKDIALELKNYGINMNFAPVLDVNTNSNNPIIGERAFSNNADDVISGAKVVLKEYEKYGIIAVGKHFPGHGDASKDSHKTLPVIDLSVEDLEINHIRPFKEAINNNMPAIMAAHVVYPNLDKDYPASVSKKIINELLIQKLGFKGLIITDDMEMNGIKGLSRIQACTLALNAGVNMFIFRDTTKEIFDLINKIAVEVNNGNIDENKINTSVQKVIDLKYQYRIIQ